MTFTEVPGEGGREGSFWPLPCRPSHPSIHPSIQMHGRKSDEQRPCRESKSWEGGPHAEEEAEPDLGNAEVSVPSEGSVQPMHSGPCVLTAKCRTQPLTSMAWSRTGHEFASARKTPRRSEAALRHCRIVLSS